MEESRSKTRIPKFVGNDENVPTDDIEALHQTLERKTCLDGSEICLYNGFWCRAINLRPTIRFQNHFKARDTDIMLCTKPKCGTTWLKALTFSIAKRDIYPIHQSPILTANPHNLIPFIDSNIYMENNNPDYLENIPSPRMFSTHMPYHPLPDSIRESKCRIIYICRNLLDQFTSYRHFCLEHESYKGLEPLPLDQAFDMFCEGAHPWGPFWDHVLGYWNAHIDNPRKVLFLRYEDLKRDVVFHVKKIAEFIGMPFSAEEEKEGVVEQIVNLCSFGNLKSLEINKEGNTYDGVTKNSSFFRKGQVGDWTNYLTPEMAKRFEDILRSKLEGSGLNL